jgi:hypothetical protein
MASARLINSDTSICFLWLGHATRGLSIKDWKTDDSMLEDTDSHNATLVEPDD